MKKIVKQLISIFMAVVMLIGIVPITAFAADARMNLSNCEVSWDYTLTDEKGNPFSAGYGLHAKDNPFGNEVPPMLRKMHDYTARRKGLSSDMSNWKYGEDYVYCFCIELGIPLPDNTYYSASSNEDYGNKYKLLSAEQKDLLSLALSYGYPNRTDLETVKDANACYSATQLIVWQITLGWRTSPTELTDKSYPISGYTGTATEQYCRNPYFKDYYDRILTDMANHYKRPSFTSTLQSSAPTYEMKFEGGQYTVTLTDTNNVLQNFYVSVNGGVSATVNGNTLTLSSSKPITDAVALKLNRKMPSTDYTTGFLIWTVPGKEKANQDMVSGVPANNDPVPSYLRVKAPAGHIKLVKSSEDGKVGNVPFHIVGNGFDKTVYSLSDGTLLIENLQPGIYEITEKTDNKYEPQETKRVTVVSGQTTTVTFNNVLKRGNLVVTKTAEDGFVENKTFHLYGTSLSGLKVDEYATTNKLGLAVFSDVLISGDTPYTIEEIGVEDKYVILDKQDAKIEWNKITNSSFENVLKKWRVTVTKSDKENGAPQGDATLEGAKYGIYKGDQLIDSYYTDKKGQFTTDWYICSDDWSVREISASEGYLTETDSHNIGVEPGNYTLEYNEAALDVTEVVLKGNISIIKHCDDGSTQIETPEKGAEFEVFLKSSGIYSNAKDSERDILVCDEFGFAQSKNLPYGIYTVLQTKGWEGKEFIPSFDVFISKNGETYRYIINNATFEALIEIVKKDIETDKIIPASDIGFKVRDLSNGEYLTQHINYPTPVDIDVFYTDSTGKLMLPKPLKFGKYEIVEVQTCDGYVLDSTPVPFSVDGDKTIVTIEKHNVAQKGKITITKSGEAFSSVLEEEGVYQPIYSVVGLKNAVYEIYADEDIITLDGTVRAKKGELVDTVQTDKSGVAISKALYLGKYKIVEKEAPYGMTLNKESAYVELVYAGQEIEITYSQADFYNERQKVQIELSKVLEQDERFGIGMNGEILSVQFGLYAAEDLVAADGSKIFKNGLLEVVSCNEYGKAVFSTDLPVGSSVYIKEYCTDEHYQISDKKYPVTFEYAGQDTETVCIEVNGGEAISNDIIRGIVAGKKIDEEGFGICGAIFGLFRFDEKEFAKENALMIAQSNEIGMFCFENVPYGKWLVKELKPAPAFVLNDKAYTVEIDENVDFIEIEVENHFVVGSVQTTKIDAEYPDNKLTGAIFEIYVDVNNNGFFDIGLDKLVGEMNETEMGVYRMEGLRYNGYFLLEKTAPEGFLKDNIYHYFEIRNDGETVIVENEAGVGFTNKPITGELEITKRDISTGVLLPNVGFRIRNEKGEIVEEGYTDENGIAKFKLRYGKYTYQEFDALDNYKIDDTPYPFEITEDGQIIKAVMTNEKNSVPKIPETGGFENNDPLLILFCTTLPVLFFFCNKYKYKNKRGCE